MLELGRVPPFYARVGKSQRHNDTSAYCAKLLQRVIACCRLIFESVSRVRHEIMHAKGAPVAARSSRKPSPDSTLFGTGRCGDQNNNDDTRDMAKVIFGVISHTAWSSLGRSQQRHSAIVDVRLVIQCPCLIGRFLVFPHTHRLAECLRVDYDPTARLVVNSERHLSHFPLLEISCLRS